MKKTNLLVLTLSLGASLFSSQLLAQNLSCPANIRLQKTESLITRGDNCHLLTVKEYMTFLNAIAEKSDSHHLYAPSMETIILRSNVGDYYSYSIVAGKAEDPMLGLTQLDAMRYCNWIENDSPSESETSNFNSCEAATEIGAYVLNDDEVTFINPEANCHLVKNADEATGFYITQKTITSERSPLMMFGDEENNGKTSKQSSNTANRSEITRNNDRQGSVGASNQPIIQRGHFSTGIAESTFLNISNINRLNALTIAKGATLFLGLKKGRLFSTNSNRNIQKKISEAINKSHTADLAFHSAKIECANSFHQWVKRADNIVASYERAAEQARFSSDAWKVAANALSNISDKTSELIAQHDEAKEKSLYWDKKAIIAQQNAAEVVKPGVAEAKVAFIKAKKSWKKFPVATLASGRRDILDKWDAWAMLGADAVTAKGITKLTHTTADAIRTIASDKNEASSSVAASIAAAAIHAEVAARAAAHDRNVSRVRILYGPKIEPVTIIHDHAAYIKNKIATVRELSRVAFGVKGITAATLGLVGSSLCYFDGAMLLTNENIETISNFIVPYLSDSIKNAFKIPFKHTDISIVTTFGASIGAGAIAVIRSLSIVVDAVTTRLDALMDRLDDIEDTAHAISTNTNHAVNDAHVATNIIDNINDATYADDTIWENEAHWAADITHQANAYTNSVRKNWKNK